MSKTGNKTGAKGGQLKNKNALKHGAYAKFIDRRTYDGKWIQRTALAWIQDLGGADNLSTMQLAILDDLAIIAWRTRKLGREIVMHDGRIAESTELRFLKYHRALVDGLCELGLKRVAREVSITPQQYLQQKSLVIGANGGQQ